MTESQDIFPPPDQELALGEVEDLWPLWPEEQQRKRYTAERFAHNERLYRAIALLLGAGFSRVEIARNLGCAEKTVAAIDSRESQVVSEVKQRFGRKLLQVAAKAARRVDEEIPRMSGKDCAIATGIFVERGLNLMGEAGEKTEAKGNGMGREEFLTWLRSQVPTAGPVIDVQEAPPDGSFPVERPDSESGTEEPVCSESSQPQPSVTSLVPTSQPLSPPPAAGLESIPQPPPPPAPAAPDRAVTGGGGPPPPLGPDAPMGNHE